MFKSLLIGLLIIISTILAGPRASAQTVPAVPVANEFGEKGLLTSYVQEETLLVMGFYHCKHICQFVVRNLSKTLGTFKKYPHAVFLSIDEDEGPRDGVTLKKRMTGVDKEHWSFLTADKESIAAVVKALNFEMKRDPVSNQITHEIGFYTIKGGEVYRKISHLDIKESDLSFDSKKPTVLDEIKKFCSEFDPSKSKYGVTVLRSLILACCVFMAVAIGWFIHLRRKDV